MNTHHARARKGVPAESDTIAVLHVTPLVFQCFEIHRDKRNLLYRPGINQREERCTKEELQKGTSVSDLSKKCLDRKATPDHNPNPKNQRPQRQLEGDVQTQGGGVCCVSAAPLRPGCSANGRYRYLYTNINKCRQIFSSLLSFEFLQISRRQNHITVDNFRHPL